MGMSYFNGEQQAYMRELAAMPEAAKCACGWYRRGECPNCTPDRGGYERCGADGGYQTTCSRPRGHIGKHSGWPRLQAGGSCREWAASAPEGEPK